MITRPLIVIGAPRSGTTILFRCLALHPELWHLPAESHAILEGPLHPRLTGYESNRATADSVTDAVAGALRRRFYARAINLARLGVDPARFAVERGLADRIVNRAAILALGAISRGRRPPTIRFLEKTPKNSLRVPFLRRLFPDARFIWLRRHPVSNTDSLVAAWHSSDRLGPFRRERFATAGYPIAGELELRDYRGRWWKFALVPGWRALRGRAVADVALWQYCQCNHWAWTDLAALGEPDAVFDLRYEEFVADPVDFVRRIFAWAELPPCPAAEAFAARLPRVNEASPRGHTGGGERLRYPDAVHAAIERLPGCGELFGGLGYAVH